MTYDITTARRPGPYFNEDGDELYLPVASWPYNLARTTAAAFAEETLDIFGRSHYTGKGNIPVHDHDDWEECMACPAVPCWCFDIYEGTARR